jgi:MFS family permease
MSAAVPATASEARQRFVVASILGAAMILGWGSSFYLLTVLAGPIARDTGWPLSWIVGAMSLGFLASGLVSPAVGRAIERRGGRPVLAFGTATMAAGLLAIGFAPTLPLYVAAWIVLGVGMGAGLYDPAMATLGQLYGPDARRAITLLTLFGGLASTVCWPVSAYLVDAVGWRGTCIVYALVHLCASLPLYLLCLPREARSERGAAPAGAKAAIPAVRRAPARQRLLFVLVATGMTVAWGITAAIGIHLLTILQAQGLAFATAVAFGTLVGPSQVGARLIEMLLGQRFHPIATMIVSAALVTLGLGMLFGSPYMVAAGLVVYGAGNGLTSIVRGTLPLALFGAEGYATLMGRLGRPLMMAFALTPWAAALLLDAFGAMATIWALLFLAAGNCLVAVALSLLVRSEHGGAAPR